MLEWWAYLADILTFYNERIANESYLRTAALPDSVAGLVALLGYRPRPAIGAVGAVAALRKASRPAEPLSIPTGMQLASTATPAVPAQTFEAAASTFAGPTHVPVTAQPDPALLQRGSGLGPVPVTGEDRRARARPGAAGRLGASPGAGHRTQTGR